ncbi:hypothetical protein CPB83DRAFT_840829 [Crepidotus variabilis]|nr:hypothetical protein CPB83DRAFT_840829 [Crepidotus variabilis]
MIPMHVCLWPNLQRVFFAGVEVPGTLDLSNILIRDYTDKERELYHEIIGVIPILGAIWMPVMNANHTQHLRDLFPCSCNGDTHSIKTHVLLYVPPIPQVEHLKLAQSVNPKTSRGWNDPQCAALLAPPCFLKDIFADPDHFGAQVCNHNIKISAKEWPLFLYEDPLLVVSGREHQGLLRGPLLLRAYQCIFTGPVTGMSKNAKSNTKSQAEIHGITKVEPWGIIYAAVLVCQGLSSSSQWKEKDLRFDYLTFTNRLEELFEYDGSKWVMNLLRWWNICSTELKKTLMKIQTKTKRTTNPGNHLSQLANPALRNMHHQVHQMAAAVGRKLQDPHECNENESDPPSSNPPASQVATTPVSTPPSASNKHVSSPAPAPPSTLVTSSTLSQPPPPTPSTPMSPNANGKL